MRPRRAHRGPPRCGPGSGRAGRATSRAATSSSSSRPRNAVRGPHHGGRRALRRPRRWTASSGYHVTSMAPPGLVGLRPGIAMSEAHSLTITLRGGGGHGAMPTDQGDVVRAVAVTVGGAGGHGGRGSATRGPTACAAPACCARAPRSTSSPSWPSSRAPCAPSPTTNVRRPSAASGRCAGSLGPTYGVAVDLEVAEPTPAVVNDPSVTAAGSTRRHGRCRRRAVLPCRR